MGDLITRKPTATMTELLRKGAASPKGIMTLSDHNDRTQDGILRRDMADVVAEHGATHSWLVINTKGRAYVSTLDAQEAQEAQEAPQGAEDTEAKKRVRLVAQVYYPKRKLAALRAIDKPGAVRWSFRTNLYSVRKGLDVSTRDVDWACGHGLAGHAEYGRGYHVVLTTEGRRWMSMLAERVGAEEAPSAPQAAEERPVVPVAQRYAVRRPSGHESGSFATHAEALAYARRIPGGGTPVPVAATVAAPLAEAPLPPVTDDFASMGAAVDFLAGLKMGDRVRITQEGRTRDYSVSMPARRSGSQGTVKVTVSLGPGRYAFEVSAGNLFAQRGDKSTMTFGGTRMSRTPLAPSAPATTEETTVTETPVPAPKTVGPRLAAAYERRDAVLAAMDAGRAVEYLPAHRVMSRVFRQDVTGMRATRAYWVNANNGAEEVALRSTQEQARTYAHSFKALARVEHGPHACTLVFADGTTEELISYDVVCILPAA